MRKNFFYITEWRTAIYNKLYNNEEDTSLKYVKTLKKKCEKIILDNFKIALDEYINNFKNGYDYIINIELKDSYIEFNYIITNNNINVYDAMHAEENINNKIALIEYIEEFKTLLFEKIYNTLKQIKIKGV
jgi:hypothetical protein